MTYKTMKRDFEREKSLFYDDMKAYGYKALLNELTPLTRAIEHHRSGAVKKTQPKKAGDLCPLHSSRKGDKFTLNGNVEETGAGRCWKCGRVDFFDILTGFNAGWEFKDAAEAIRNIIYPSGSPKCFVDGRIEYGDGSEVQNAQLPKPKPAPKVPELTEWEKKRAKKLKAQYNELWDASLSTNDPDAEPARQYFINRCMLSYGELGADVRFHPALEFIEKVEAPAPDADMEDFKFYAEKVRFLSEHIFYQSHSQNKDGDLYFNMGTHPALLIMMRDTKTGEAKAMHRIYLSPEGSKMELHGHFEIDIKKRMPAIPGVSSHGAACCIDIPHSGIIGIAEGLETTLAVRGAIRMPMHCTIDLNGIRGYQPPNQIHTVVIWVDKDRSEAGMNGALDLKERLEALGYRVVLVVPTLPLNGAKSVDWQDVVEELGISGFPEQLRNWQDNLIK